MLVQRSKLEDGIFSLFGVLLAKEEVMEGYVDTHVQVKWWVGFGAGTHHGNATMRAELDDGKDLSARIKCLVFYSSLSLSLCVCEAGTTTFVP